MKSTITIQTPMFFNSALPMSGAWGETSQRIVRRPSHPLRLPSLLNTDELAATKPEVACGSVLALCFFYTLAHCFVQIAS